MSLIEDIKKPFNIIMLAITLIAIVLSIIFYVSSIKKKEPVYSISETQLQIFNSNLGGQNISIFDKRGNRINENIYIATCIFWNNGQLGIDSSEVKKAISITLTNGAKLIDHKIIRSIHPEIAHYILSVDTTNQKEKLLLHWGLLDPGFGVEIQIIYSNRHESSINVDGYISESNIIKAKIKNLSSWEFLVALFLFIYYSISLAWDIKRRKYDTAFRKITLIVGFFCLVALVFFILSDVFSHNSPF